MMMMAVIRCYLVRNQTLRLVDGTCCLGTKTMKIQIIMKKKRLPVMSMKRMTVIYSVMPVTITVTAMVFGNMLIGYPY